MQKALKLSIVIPAYNEESHLKACLDSIARLTEKPYEVIVVDNNSSDKTVLIAKSYSFVRLIHEKRQGVVFARSRGFDTAKGDIICRIDADCILPKNWTKHISHFYSQPQNLNRAWTGGGYFYNLRWRRLMTIVQDLLVFRFNWLLTGGYVLWGSNQATTKDMWHKVRDKVCYEGDIHEDIDLAFHLRYSGFTIFYDNSIKVGAMMRRMRSERSNLWSYLQWWPRTLKHHGYKLWVLCWFVGVFLTYIGSFLPMFVERIARLVGAKPLAEVD